MTEIATTWAQEVAVEAVRIQAAKDEYGPLFEVDEIGEGHPLHDEDGICPTCGRLQVDSPQHQARKAAAIAEGRTGYFPDTCFEHALFTVEFTYNDQGHRALYGVPAEGPPSCWAS